MEVGLKTYSDKDGYKFLQEVAEAADFIELLPIPENNFWKKFDRFDKPVTIHAPHQLFGFNPADRDNKQNKRCIETALDAADYFESDVIVVHPGNWEQSKSRHEAISESLRFLKKFNEPRFYIENLPLLDSIICNVPEEVEQFVKNLSCKFCFDFGHAAITAFKMGVDIKQIMNRFNQLNPKYYHICGIKFKPVMDHLSLKENKKYSDFFKGLVHKNSRIVLETPHTVDSSLREIKFLKDEIPITDLR